MKKSVYKYNNGEVQIMWVICEWDDYYTFAEHNSLYNKANYLSIPKRLLDKFREMESEK